METHQYSPEKSLSIESSAAFKRIAELAYITLQQQNVKINSFEFDDILQSDMVLKRLPQWKKILSEANNPEDAEKIEKELANGLCIVIKKQF